MSLPAPFVVGVPRSGTTLLRLMLDAHPALAIPPETYFVPNLIEAGEQGADAERVARLVGAHRRWPDLGLDTQELLARLRAAEPLGAGDGVRAVFGLYAERHGKPRWGDKTPAYLTSIDRIGAALPEARFVHVIRDGRAVANSILRMPPRDRPLRNPTDAAEVAKRWRKRIVNGRAHGLAPERYLEVRYEELVADPEPVLRTVCAAIELDWDPRVLEHDRAAGERLAEVGRELPARGSLPAQPVAARLDPHARAAETVASTRAEAWREELGEDQVAAFERVAGDLLAELGYPRP